MKNYEYFYNYTNKEILKTSQNTKDKTQNIIKRMLSDGLIKDDVTGTTQGRLYTLLLRALKEEFNLS